MQYSTPNYHLLQLFPASFNLKLPDVYYLIATTFAGILLWRITTFAIDNFIGIYFSDAWGMVLRYQSLLEGKMSFFDYVFMRHGNHPHAIMYLLGYLDIIWFYGTLNSLQIASLIFALLSYLGFQLILIQDKNLPLMAKFYLSLLIAAFVFNACMLPMWILPFQVVIASVRILFIAALILILFSIYTPSSNSNLSLSLGLICAWLAAAAYGNGFLIFPAILAITLSLRRFKAFYWSVATMLSFFAFVALLQRTRSPLALQHVLKALSLDYAGIMYYAMVYIGGGLVRIPEHTFIAGLIGTILASAVLIEFTWRAWKKPISLTPLQLFFIAYLLIIFGSAFLVTIYYHALSYVIVLHKIDTNYFMAGRYFINSSVFWLSLLILLSDQLFRATQLKTATTSHSELFWSYRISFSAVILLVLFGLIWQSENQIYSHTNANNNVTKSTQISKVALKSGVFDQQFIDHLFIPAGPQYKGIEILKQRGLNIFSQTDYPPCNKKIIPKTSLLTGIMRQRMKLTTPVPNSLSNFTNGQRIYGYFPEVTNGNIYIMDETRRLVGYGAFLPHAKPLRLTAKNFDSDFYLKRYPGIAKHPRYQSVDGAWRHWNEFGKQEGHIALICATGGSIDLRPNFIGFVPQAYVTHKLTPVLCEYNCIENR